MAVRIATTVVRTTVSVGPRHIDGHLARLVALRGLHDARRHVDGSDGARLVTHAAVGGVGAVDAVAHVAHPVAAAHQLAGASAACRLAMQQRLLLRVVATRSEKEDGAVRCEEDVEQLGTFEKKDQGEDTRAEEQQHDHQTNHTPQIVALITRNRKHLRTVQERATRTRQIVANETLEQVLSFRIDVKERIVLTTGRHNHHIAASCAALVHQLAQCVLLRIRVVREGDLVSRTANIRGHNHHYNEKPT